MNRQIVEIIFDGIRALGRNRELFIIFCKKWLVAKWLVEKMRPNAKMPLLDDIFSEDVKELPELGEIYPIIRKKRAIVARWCRCFMSTIKQKNWRFVWTLQIFI